MQNVLFSLFPARLPSQGNFFEQLEADQKSISVFLLLSILSVSARFTKCLLKRYGDATKATDYFLDRAGELIPNEIYEPSLERTQALFLLGVSEWTQGKRTRSAVGESPIDIFNSALTTFRSTWESQCEVRSIPVVRRT